MTMEGALPIGDGETVNAAASPSLSQEQVNKIVAREKQMAAEKARREAQAQHEQEMAQFKQSQGAMGGMAPAIDEDRLFNQFEGRLMEKMKAQQQEQAAAQHEQEMYNVAGNYLSKMAKGKDLYDDFEAVTAEFDPEAFPQVLLLASKAEDTAHIMYELSKNPAKLVTINDLALRSPKMAINELKKMTDSIKANVDAKDSHIKTNPPLSRLQPSASAGADGGGMSIKDFKKQPWLRG